MKSISNTLLAAICAVVFTIMVAVLLSIPIFSSKELQTGDELMYLRYHLTDHAKSKPDPRLVMAAIDEVSTQEIGEWPFHRTVHGQFLQDLAPEKPKVVGWDIFFFEAKGAPIVAPDPNALPVPLTAEQTEDQSLLTGTALFGNMVLAARRNVEDSSPPKNEDTAPTRPITHIIGDIKALLSSNNAVLPFPALRKESFFGFADETGDAAGGVRRRVPLVLNIGGQVLPSFDLQVLMQYLNVDPDKVTVTLGQQIVLTKPDGSQLFVPIDEVGRMTINYRGRLEDFRAMSYAYMGKGLEDKAGNVASDYAKNLPAIKDNIVIVGVTFPGTDAGTTPLDLTAPLVVTHLNAMNNILQQDFVRAAPSWVWMPVYALFLFGLGSWMLRVGILPMILIALAGMVILAATVFGLLCLGNLQVPVAMPEVGLLLLAIAVPSNGFFGEGREKARIKAAMSACLSEKVMVKMLEHPDNVKLGGVKQEITVMFCDIRGFTAYCDQRDSQEVLDVLNEYMEVMTQVVFKYDGTIDKYIGDCIMAFWNAPAPQADHAQRAVCCAMEMRYALANFKTQRAGLDHELFECGIGIHTGEALVGMMGSSIKRNYTTMGSSVNLAARLESLTKRLNERILISQEVVDQLQGDFPLTDRGEALVPGFTNPVHVYAVVADQDISSALKVGRRLAQDLAYKGDEVQEPMWEPAPLPEHSDPGA